MAEITKEGFVKTTRPEQINVNSKDKAALIRKGNQLFNSGEIETARKIFVNLGYTDGIIRVGDYYQKNNQYMEAFKMYCMAPDPMKKANLVARMAAVVQGWMYQESENN